AISVFFTFVVFVSSLSAQSLPAPSPDPSVQNPQAAVAPVEKGFAHQFLTDQVSIWTSPAKIRKADAKWLAPLVGGTAFRFTQDNAISHHFDGKTSLQNDSLKVSDAGQISVFAVPGAFLAMGGLTHNHHAIDTGKRGTEAAIYTTITAQTLKALTNRARPSQ